MIKNQTEEKHQDLLIRGLSAVPPELVKKSLDKGLSPDICMSNGMPAAEFLIRDCYIKLLANDTEVVISINELIEKLTLLLEAGLNVITEPGLSILFTSVEVADEFEEYDEGLLSIKILWLLLKYGASTESFDSKGVPLLYHAFRNLRTDLISEFVKLGINVNCLTLISETSALLKIIEYADHFYLQSVIDARAHINEQDNSGKTALMHVCSTIWNNPRNVPTIEILLRAGAKVNLMCNEGETVLDYARERGNLAVVEVLEDAGTKIGAEVRAADKSRKRDRDSVLNPTVKRQKK